MDSKYFPLDFDDVCVGFEYEVESSPYEPCWTKEKIENLHELELFARYTKKDPDCSYRVPYLTFEQLEAEGFDYCGSTDLYSFFFDNFFSISYSFEHKYMEIRKIYLSEEENSEEKVFKGQVRCINDFRKIAKLIGIK